VSPGREPAAVIVLRQSPNWGRLTPAYLDETEPIDRALRRPPGFTRSFIELWDATFRTTFFEVRKALKDITLRSFAAVRDADVVPFTEVGDWPPAPLVLFSDDDDWFAPDVVEKVASFSRKLGGVTWDSTVLYRGMLVRRSDAYCYTNNYAVTERVRLPGPWTERVLPHGKAEVTFRRRGFRAGHLPLPLSVANNHPASAQQIRVVLDRRPGRDGLIEEVEAFRESAALAGSPAGDLAWAAEPVAAAVELFGGLALR